MTVLGANDAVLKRWMRHDAHRFIRPDWRRFVQSGSQLAGLYERYERKFDPSQPRVPAGQPEGGQWTSGTDPSASATASTQSDQSIGQSQRSTAGSEAVGQSPFRIAGRIPSALQAECEEQYRKDTFICNTVRTNSCWEQAAFRKAQCLGGRYIPPIYH